MTNDRIRSDKPGRAPGLARMTLLAALRMASAAGATEWPLSFRERLSGASATGTGKSFHASVVLADGRLCAVRRHDSTLVFDAKPEFNFVARNQSASDHSDFNATPAIAGRQLFLRFNRKLYCIESLQTGGAASNR